MSGQPLFSQLYHPDQMERARQSFVSALKAQVNGPLEQRLGEHYESEVKPRLAGEGSEPQDRDTGAAALTDEPLYQMWQSLTYTSQDLMWETVGDTVDRVLTAMEARGAAISESEQLGSLALDPQLALPEPIASTEIHRQPGGYFLGQQDADLTAAALYAGTLVLYTAAKGFVSGGDTFASLGQGVARMVEPHLGGAKPARILDMGCGPGTITLGLKQHFPEAEVYGVDLSASFVRFAHLWAEDAGQAIAYRQGDAAQTGLEAGSFDLIVSQIMFHETWHDKAPEIFAEAYRLLRPGGLMLNIDVPYQPDRLSIPQQVTNHWQVKNNGEPFWTGFADSSVRDLMSQAGVPEGEQFADYVPVGPAREYLVFGIRRSGA
ncbi:MAG: class I SAM-dependent methyltransferase [Pseudomonadota bacterium]